MNSSRMVEILLPLCIIDSPKRDPCITGEVAYYLAATEP